MSMLYMTLGTQEELRDQIVDCARGPGLPGRALARQPGSSSRCAASEGKGRLGLLAQEVGRLAHARC